MLSIPCFYSLGHIAPAKRYKSRPHTECCKRCSTKPFAHKTRTRKQKLAYISRSSCCSVQDRGLSSGSTLRQLIRLLRLLTASWGCFWRNWLTACERVDMYVICVHASMQACMCGSMGKMIEQLVDRHFGVWCSCTAHKLKPTATTMPMTHLHQHHALA
jgi:hypothetical protein